MQQDDHQDKPANDDRQRRLTLRLDATSAEQLARLQRRHAGQSVSALLKLALARAAEATEPAPSAATKSTAPKPGDIQPAPALTGADGRRVRLFTLAFDPALGGFDDGPLRAFLAGRELIALDKQFFQQDGRSYWSIWVQYRDPAAADELGPKPPDDLTDEDRRLFEALRDWRRETARDAGVPVYVVATNRQLESIAQQRPQNRGALAGIQGFGKQKLARYGDGLLALLAAFMASETQRASPRGTGPTADDGDDPPASVTADEAS